MGAFKKVCTLGVAGAMVAVSLPAAIAASAAQAATVVEQPPNDSIELANAVAMGDTVSGTLAPVLKSEKSTVPVETDCFKFTVGKKSGIKLSFTNEQSVDSFNMLSATLYDSNKKAIDSFEEESGSSFGFSSLRAPETRSLSWRPLSTGTYYLELHYKGAVGSRIPYHFNLSYVDFGTPLKSVTGAKKSLVVKWSKKSGASSYQVRYTPVSTYNKSGWKKAKTKSASKDKSSLKLSKLKAKTKYKVQVRAVYEMDEDVYGYFHWRTDWSAARNAKTK